VQGQTGVTWFRDLITSTPIQQKVAKILCMTHTAKLEPGDGAMERYIRCSL